MQRVPQKIFNFWIRDAGPPWGWQIWELQELEFLDFGTIFTTQTCSREDGLGKMSFDVR